MAIELTTLADIKVYIGIDSDDTEQDAVLTMFKESVEESVRIYTEQTFEPKVVVAEILDGTQADIIVPKHFPIISVQAVYLGLGLPSSDSGILLDPSQYYFDEGSISLVDFDTPFRRGSVRVDYTWGYAAVPGNVKMAIYQSIKAEMQRRSRNTEDIMSRGKGDESESYGRQSVNGTVWDSLTGLPKAVVAKLQSYRVYEFPNINMAQRNR